MSKRVSNRMTLTFLAIILLGVSTEAPRANDSDTEIKSAKLNQNSKTNPKHQLNRHCVEEVKLRFEEVYMFNNWYGQAKQTALKRWQENVKNRYGSVYSNWMSSSMRKNSCKRIGFGNDDFGNIGRTVICEISANPCADLTPGRPNN